MTLTTNGTNYIAEKFGNTSKCYVPTGLNWSYLGTDNITYNETGGTAQIVARLVMTALAQSVIIGGVTYTYGMLKAANDNTDVIFPADVQWIGLNDGSPVGETQYCLTTGSISGNVKDSSNTNLSGATVSDGTRNTTTDSNGNYTIPNVPAGTYTVTASKTGYVTGSLSNIVVTAGYTTTNVNFNLSPVTGTTGYIVCNTTPPGASITIDGNPTGKTTPDTLTVSASTSGIQHTVIYQNSGYDNCTKTVTVFTGGSEIADCTMSITQILTRIEVTSSTGNNNVEKSKTLQLNILCRDQFNNAMLCPIGGVTWTSSNSNIASVTNGIVTGISIGGPVTIYATAGSIFGTISITVVPTTEAKPSSSGLIILAIVAIGAIVITTRKR